MVLYNVTANVTGEPASIQQRDGQTEFDRSEAEDFQRSLILSGFDRVDIIEAQGKPSGTITAPASTPNLPLDVPRQTVEYNTKTGEPIIITGATQEQIEQQRNVERAIAEGKLQESERESIRQQILGITAKQESERKQAQEIAEKASQGITAKEILTEFRKLPESYQTTSTLSSIAESSKQRQLVALPLTILGQPKSFVDIESLRKQEVVQKAERQYLFETGKISQEELLGKQYPSYSEARVMPTGEGYTAIIYPKTIKEKLFDFYGGAEKKVSNIFSPTITGFGIALKKQSDVLKNLKGKLDIKTPTISFGVGGKGTYEYQTSEPEPLTFKGQAKGLIKIAEFGTGAGIGFLKSFEEKPIENIGLAFASGTAFSGAVSLLPKTLTKISLIGGTIKYGLPVIYGGVKGIEIYQAPTSEAKGEVVGKAVATEIIPFILGAKVADIGITKAKETYVQSILRKPNIEFDIGITTTESELGVRGVVQKPFAQSIISKEKFADVIPKTEIELYNLRTTTSQSPLKPIREVDVYITPNVEIIGKPREISFEERLRIGTRQKPFFEAEAENRFLRVEKGKVTKGVLFEEPLYDLKQLGYEPKITYQPRTYFFEVEIGGKKSLFVKKGSQTLKVESETKPLIEKPKEKVTSKKPMESEMDLGKGQIVLQLLEPPKAEVELKQKLKQKPLQKSILEQEQKQKAKPSQLQELEQVTKSKLTPNLFPALSMLASRQKQNTLQKSSLIVEQEQKVKPIILQVLEQKQKQKQNQYQLVGLIALQKPVQVPAQIPIQVPIQKVEQISILDTELITEPILKFPPFIPTKTPPRTPPRQPPRLEPPKTPPLLPQPKEQQAKRAKALKQQLNQKAYDVLIKAKQKKLAKGRYKSKGFMKANKEPLTKKAAIGLGSSIVDTYANRSFTLKEAKGTPIKRSDLEAKARVLAYKFRTAKRNKNIFVEKETFAIDSKEEVRQIPYEALRQRISTRRQGITSAIRKQAILKSSQDLFSKKRGNKWL